MISEEEIIKLNINPFQEMKRIMENRKDFVGVPIDMDFQYVSLLVNDYNKKLVGGISKSAFLVCVTANYLNEANYIVLLRVLDPISLPHSQDYLSSKIEYYKEFSPGGELDFADKMDPYTKNEFQYSGLKCRVLGTYYCKFEGTICFGSDVDNFYSAHNYICYKPTNSLLTYLLNNSSINKKQDYHTSYSRIGVLRYTSTLLMDKELNVPIYFKVDDLLDRRTALFGMTRTGKSNTVKKIIDATTELSISTNRKIGQIIFDINGEYANPNKQDKGTAIYEKYISIVSRYSLMAKDRFVQMKINFFNNPQIGYELAKKFISEEKADYVKNFLSIDFNPIDKNSYDESEYWGLKNRYDRKIAALLCIFEKATLKVPTNFTYYIKVNKDLLTEVNEKFKSNFDFESPKSLGCIFSFYDIIWEKYEEINFFSDYKKSHNKDWIDEDLSALLHVLTLKKRGTTHHTCSGFKKLKRSEFLDLHTIQANLPFEKEILKKLRDGEIVIIDLSEGNEMTRDIYSERIVKCIFEDSMKRFIKNEDESNGFNSIQLYFEEAHNLFPKNGNNIDLTNIYNRLAKEGAKYHLGINYATQEPSSISANILKNTQNWFVAHLNNTDEIKEVKKYYDFSDFEENILKAKDQGFIKMKTITNDFVVPIQIDKFVVIKEE